MPPRFKALLQSNWYIPTACSVVSFGAGAAVGYLFAMRKHTEPEVVKEPDNQLSFEFEQEPYVPGAAIDIAFNERNESFLNHPSQQEPNDDTKEGGDVVSIFVEDLDWNYDEELMRRNDEEVYIIHRDEFFNDEMNWDSQSTLTYYEGDQILCDENDVPIYNPDDICGPLIFGHGSRDPNVVYIRNEKLQCEYEVLRDSGSYEIDVLGGQVERQMQQDDLRHSRHPTKFRFE